MFAIMTDASTCVSSTSLTTFACWSHWIVFIQWMNMNNIIWISSHVIWTKRNSTIKHEASERRKKKRKTWCAVNIFQLWLEWKKGTTSHEKKRKSKANPTRSLLMLEYDVCCWQLPAATSFIIYRLHRRRSSYVPFVPIVRIRIDAQWNSNGISQMVFGTVRLFVQLIHHIRRYFWWVMMMMMIFIIIVIVNEVWLYRIRTSYIGYILL